MMRIVFYFMLLFAVPYVQAQEKVEVTISDTLLQSGKEVLRLGGQANWEESLRRKINPSVLIENGAPNGTYTVQVQYIVNKDGNIADTRPRTSFGYGMEQEIIRLLKKETTRWTSATQEKIKSEKAYGKITVTFIKENDNYHVTTATPHTLYVGADNQVTVSAKNLKPKRLKVTVSKNASIKRAGDFTYIVKVNTPGERVIFTLKKKGKNKVLSKHSIATTPALPSAN